MQGVVSGAVVHQGGVPHVRGREQHREFKAFCSLTACARTEPCSAAVKAARVSASPSCPMASIVPAVPRPHVPCLPLCWQCHISMPYGCCSGGATSSCPNHGTYQCLPPTQQFHVPTGLLPLSPWSEWTPCSTCLPLFPSHLGDVTPHVSVQHRYRACLDPQSGQPWSGDTAVCSAELQQQRLCPDPDICQGTTVPQGMGVRGPLCPPPSDTNIP